VRLFRGRYFWMMLAGLMLWLPPSAGDTAERAARRLFPERDEPLLPTEVDVLIEPTLDLERYLDHDATDNQGLDTWGLQLLPDGLIYRPYLAGPKESRLATQFVYEKDDGWLWDAMLGTQVGLLRFGSADADWPVGFQIDVEGSAQLRMDPPEDFDIRSVDFRGGVPLTWGVGQSRTKLAYYHLSGHLGDEFLLSNPGFQRLNITRDVLVLGHSIYVTPRLRLYGEAGWAFDSEISDDWEFQFGVDYAPYGPTGPAGSPFFAANGHLREEVNFGGGLTVQAGWAWRGVTGRMVRAGVQYYNGESAQYSFFDEHEQFVGFGLWYDR
jgi:hypothetical protein